jgi:hypothetical protein
VTHYRDEDGDYVATVEPCVACDAGVEITVEHREHGNGPWCASCSAVFCGSCWDVNTMRCALCDPGER